MRRETSSGAESYGHGRVEVAAGNVTDRVGHGQDCQSEGERDTDKSDAERRKGRSQYGAATTTQDQPERADEFGRESFVLVHDSAFLFVFRRYCISAACYCLPPPAGPDVLPGPQGFLMTR